MIGCVYQESIDELSFSDCRFASLFNKLHFSVCVGVHQTQLVHEVTVVQDGDRVCEPIANSYSCNVMGFMTRLNSSVLTTLNNQNAEATKKLMCLSLCLYARISFICILSSP